MTIKNANPSTLGGIFGLVLIAGTAVAKCVQSLANGGNNNNNSSSYNANTRSYYYPRTVSNGQGGYVPYTTYANNNYYSAPTTNQYPYAGYNNEAVSYYGNYNNSGMKWGYDPMEGSRRNMTNEEYLNAIMKANGAMPSSSMSYGYAYGSTTSKPIECVSWKSEPFTSTITPNPTYTPPTTQYASIVAPQYSSTNNTFTYPTQTTQYTAPSYTVDSSGTTTVPGYDPTSRRNCGQANTTATTPSGFAQPVYQNPTPTTNTFDWNDQISSKISTDNSATNYWSSHLVPIGQSNQTQYQSPFQYQQQTVNQFQSNVNPYGMSGQYNYGYGYGSEAFNNPSSYNYGYNYNVQNPNQFQTTTTNTNYNGYGYAYSNPVQYSYGNNQSYTGYQDPSSQLYNNQFFSNNNQNYPYGWPGQNSTNVQPYPASDAEAWLRSRDDITNFTISDVSKKSYRNDSYGKIPTPQVIIRQPVMQQPIQQPNQQMIFPQVHEPPCQVPQEQYQQYQSPNVVPTPEQINNNNQQYQRPATNEQPQQLSACDRFFCDIPSTVIPEQNKVTVPEQQQNENSGRSELANLKIPENAWFKFGNRNNNPITAPVVNPFMIGKETLGHQASEESEQYQEEERPYPTLAEVRAKLGAEQAARVTIEKDENGKMISYHFNNVEDDKKSNDAKKEKTDESSVEEATPAFILG